MEMESYKEVCCTEDSNDNIKEIIGNEIVLMSPVHYVHNLIMGNVYRAFYSKLKDKKCKVFQDTVAYDLSDLDNNLGGKGKFVSPDVSVVCNPSFSGALIKSYPSLVIEILSPKTAIRDLTTKKELYASMGIRDYLIIGRDGNVEHYYLVNGKYREPRIITRENSFISSVIDNVEIKYDEVYEGVLDLL